MTVEISFTFSLWWVIGYLVGGLLAGVIVIMAEWLSQEKRRRRPIRLLWLARALLLWGVGWPVCWFLLIKEAAESRRDLQRATADPHDDQWVWED